MGFFNRPAAEVEAEAFVPEPGSRYEGAAIFREGFYYPILNDEHSQEIGPAVHMPLVWVNDSSDPRGGYLAHAAAEDPNHFHQYGLNPIELAPGAEEPV